MIWGNSHILGIDRKIQIPNFFRKISYDRTRVSLKEFL
ncbi:hypothetical protein LEP1GSC172_3501 [Leptospira noguchii]|uniref:Uncharacterized protein n=1 Tax=Leptospira noguchii TaxID=28182 RepID=M6VIR9_9LEPT|nr:hypothetical protein LEP1GSC172_3501 [Leptospira noguchii]